ncbi:pilus assembly protein [Pseudoduganella sp. R-32]|uniref:pilus assembly protein n=1 Tax=Pseudoduganella sp. R-32 TaxID=3404061 RepID=UPI003CEBBCB9
MRPLFKQLMLAALFTGSVLGAALSRAASTDLADKPLANSTTVQLLPNIMLDLDNSGSMLWSYMPDYVRVQSNGSYLTFCRYSNGSLAVICHDGDPPFAASAFNKVYYNPAVRYDWPTTADGKRLADATTEHRTEYLAPWSNIPSDGYGIQDIDKTYSEPLYREYPCGVTNPYTGRTIDCKSQGPNETVNLQTYGSVKASYPDRVWCPDSSSKEKDCKRAVEGTSYAYPTGDYSVAKEVKGAPYYYNVTVKWCTDNSATNCADLRDNTYKTVVFGKWERVDIVPTRSSYPKAPTRTDCPGVSCSYDNEMTNFATWYAWYRTRTQMTKTAIGLAFKDVRGNPKSMAEDKTDPSYFHTRLGMMTIDNKTIAVPIAPFEGVHKQTFFDELYKLYPNTSTPLRNALNEVGRLYKFGKNDAFPDGKNDPIEAACQRNFVILATDGYWNGNQALYTDDPKSTLLKDQDGDIKKAPRPSYAPYKAGDGTRNNPGDQVSLADIAFYYYNNDLRPDMENIVPSAGGNKNINDVANHQHMTTFTLGLGVDGTLAYSKDYKTAKTGDYYKILQGGTKEWPAPLPNDPTAIDDLWHAAVSGRGSYFSAKDPTTLQESLHQALGSIGQSDGSGAAAATSNLNPVEGDNFIYLANYRTQLWDGELSAYAINVQTGEITGDPKWQAGTLLRSRFASDGSDSRTIWTSDASNRLVPFKAANLDKSQLAFFSKSVQRSLSQFKNWTSKQVEAADETTLVNFLRGQDPLDKDGMRLYRERDKVLGDFIHSQPIYVKNPPFGFLDEGYAAYTKTDRDAIVYAAANDGMLHAFDAKTGEERWAYIPPMVLPDLWQLANKDYADRHRYYLDGAIIVSDVKIGKEWMTILIGAMGKGGRGYYALDITNPKQPPKVLWTYTADDNPNLGYSFGPAQVTKLEGKWVAVLTSGYNNIAENGKYDGDGQGHVFILDLADPKNVVDISTGAGDRLNPSGLARINIAAVKDFYTDNTEDRAYGGDLQGNLWRFNLKQRTATKVMELGNTRPITAAPDLTRRGDGTIIVYFGTGRFLGASDLVVPEGSMPTQIVAAVKDVVTDGPIKLESLAVQTMDQGADTRKGTTDKAVDWDKDKGWYLELPSKGERVAIDPHVFDGIFLVPSVVPTASACQPGGYSWLYQFSTAGAKRDVPVGTRLVSPVVGTTLSRLSNDKAVVFAITADGKRPKSIPLNTPSHSGGGDGDSNNGDPVTRRLQWRELVK